MNKKLILSLVPAALFLASCEKVIDIDLNSKSPRVVIEANIDDQPGPYTVRLSTTVNFDEPNTFPGISGALVTITDDQAGTDTLSETEPGVYRTNSTTGVYGHTYTLVVRTPAGQVFSSTERMPELIALDSIKVDSLSFFGTTAITFTPYYKDSPVSGNRYRFRIYRNNNLINEPLVFEDRFNNGLTNTRPLIVDEEWESGDSARIEKQDITQGIYDYFNSLQLSNDGQTASPANPLSNLSNGALGYFSVHTRQARTVVVP